MSYKKLRIRWANWSLLRVYKYFVYLIRPKCNPCISIYTLYCLRKKNKKRKNSLLDINFINHQFYMIRGANEMRQLASYSDSTLSKLDSCEFDSSSRSTRNVN